MAATHTAMSRVQLAFRIALLFALGTVALVVSPIIFLGAGLIFLVDVVAIVFTGDSVTSGDNVIRRLYRWYGSLFTYIFFGEGQFGDVVPGGGRVSQRARRARRRGKRRS